MRFYKKCCKNQRLSRLRKPHQFALSTFKQVGNPRFFGCLEDCRIKQLEFYVVNLLPVDPCVVSSRLTGAATSMGL